MLCFVAHRLGDLRKSAREVGASRLFCFNAGFSGAPNGVSFQAVWSNSIPVHKATSNARLQESCASSWFPQPFAGLRSRSFLGAFDSCPKLIALRWKLSFGFGRFRLGRWAHETICEDTRVTSSHRGSSSLSQSPDR